MVDELPRLEYFTRDYISDYTQELIPNKYGMDSVQCSVLREAKRLTSDILNNYPINGSDYHPNKDYNFKKDFEKNSRELAIEKSKYLSELRTKLMIYVDYCLETGENYTFCRDDEFLVLNPDLCKKIKDNFVEALKASSKLRIIFFKRDLSRCKSTLIRVDEKDWDWDY